MRCLPQLNRVLGILTTDNIGLVMASCKLIVAMKRQTKFNGELILLLNLDLDHTLGLELPAIVLMAKVWPRQHRAGDNEMFDGRSVVGVGIIGKGKRQDFVHLALGKIGHLLPGTIA